MFIVCSLQQLFDELLLTKEKVEREIQLGVQNELQFGFSKKTTTNNCKVSVVTLFFFYFVEPWS